MRAAKPIVPVASASRTWPFSAHDAALIVEGAPVDECLLDHAPSDRPVGRFVIAGRGSEDLSCFTAVAHRDSWIPYAVH